MALDPGSELSVDGILGDAFPTEGFIDEVLGSITPTTTVAPVLTTDTSSLSLVIDPITHDLVDTDDGWFLETGDSRTIVLWQLEATYNAWWADPFSGSRTRAIKSGEEPGAAEDLRDEALRCLQELVAEGIISDLAIVLDTDEGGRVALILNYRDRASGNLVDLEYVPFGG